jgi:DNA-binding Xre family transcriptional regulator
MAVHWRLKSFLATKYGIYGAVALQKRVATKTKVLISVQNLCNYLEKKPKSIRLETIELLCTALECELHDFCEVKLSAAIQKNKESTVKKLSYQNTPHSKRAVTSFPNPEDYT